MRHFQESRAIIFFRNLEDILKNTQFVFVDKKETKNELSLQGLLLRKSRFLEHLKIILFEM